MNAELLEKIVRAVLYEGYMLYPYRASALKNRQRWNFGVLFPEASGPVRSGAEPGSMQAECAAVAGPDAAIGATVRFLHLNAREEAVEREVAAGTYPVSALSVAPVRLDFQFGSEKTEPHDRRWETVRGTVETTASQIGEGLFKISARVRNLTPFSGAARDDALTRSLLSAHIILQAIGGEFVSLTDPPEAYRAAAEGCRNSGVWPVLVGEAGERDCMLASPIILYDYPQIAPESPGDLFDGTEIDELLTLRILTLTDEEKQAMRDGDLRARQILERSEALPVEQLMKMHGAVRGLKKG